VLQERLDGFSSAMEAAGCRPSHITGPMDYQGGIEATIRLLSERREATAVVAASDELAVGVLRAARELGLSIPQELSVVGFDDHWLADAVDLTTINQSVSTHGLEGAAMLCRHLDDGDLEPRHMLIPPRLIVRGSTATAAPSA
jgi:DNA-binding LacI/PurR family transcriptional regulator